MIEIKGSIIGAEVFQMKLLNITSRTRQNVKDEVTRLALILLTKVKEEKLSGQVLNVQSGRLRRSVRAKRARDDGDSISASVGTSLGYAAIHEFGGTTRPHLILPKNAMALLLGNMTEDVKTKSGLYRRSKKMKEAITKRIESGSLWFSKSVNHPGSKMPMRSFLRSSLEEMRQTIQDRLNYAVRKLVDGNR